VIGRETSGLQTRFSACCVRRMRWPGWVERSSGRTCATRSASALAPLVGGGRGDVL